MGGKGKEFVNAHRKKYFKTMYPSNCGILGRTELPGGNMLNQHERWQESGSCPREYTGFGPVESTAMENGTALGSTHSLQSPMLALQVL